VESGLGPVRVAQVIAAVGTADRFKGRRQFWAYCGLSVVTRSSSDYEMEGELLRKRRSAAQTRGLTRQYSRRLKRVFKSAAVEAMKDEAVKEIYTTMKEKGIRPEMARLTVARKLAAVTLSVWKSGEDYEESKLTRRDA
jgi:transposase